MRSGINDNHLNGWYWRVRGYANGEWGYWTDERMFALNRLLLDIPSSIRQNVRQEIYHKVVPNLADPEKLASNELITDPERQAAVLDREIASLANEAAKASASA